MTSDEQRAMQSDGAPDIPVLVALLWPLIGELVVKIAGELASASHSGREAFGIGTGAGALVGVAGIIFCLIAGLRARRGWGWLAWVALAVNIGWCLSLANVRA